jgi:mono/diheme cytochrome c family protein
MKTRSRRLLVLGAAVVAAPLLLTPAAPARQANTTINVTLTDKAIKLSKRAAPAGKVTFNVRNTGKQAHDFKITNKKTRVLGKGKRARLVVTFGKAGKFAYSSTRPGDARRGLRGTFTVTAARGGGANLNAGKSVFQTTGCGGCHVFKAGGGVGTVGPNLDTSKLALAAVTRMVSNGKGAMPAYKDQLSAKQIEDLSSFLVQARAG